MLYNKKVEYIIPKYKIGPNYESKPKSCFIDRNRVDTVKPMKIEENSITEEEIKAYKKELVEELKKQGAIEKEIGLISDELIINAINNKRNVSDIVWALLQ